MIKKVNILIGLLVVAMLVLKAVETLKAKMTAAPAAVAAEAAPEKPAVSDLSPVVCFAQWMGFEQLNPITNRNGYFLDIVRAIFPKARFVQLYHDEVKATLERLSTDPQAVTVTFGDHPRLKRFPRAPTPIGAVGFTLVTLRSNPWKYDGPSSLGKLKIGATNAYLDFPIVRELAEKGAKDGRMRIFDDTTSPSELYRYLFEGEIDAVIETYETSYDRLQNLLSAAVLERLKRSVRIENDVIYFRMSDLDPAFAERLTRDYEAGLKRISESGELRRIREYYGFGK